MCVGEVLLKQWKQGNTSFSKTRKSPLEIEVFFFIIDPKDFRIIGLKERLISWPPANFKTRYPAFPLEATLLILVFRQWYIYLLR